MKKLKHLLIWSCLLTTSISFGQTNLQKSEERPFIEVVGYAEKEIIPDEIFIAIVIRERWYYKVKVTIEEQEEKLIGSLKTLGIEIDNLSLSDANADYVKVRWKVKDLMAKKDYTLKVATATQVGQVFQELERIEITDASIAKVSHSKIDSLRKEVKIMAIKNAKDKADYLLTAIGEQTGKALIVTENSLGQSITREDISKLPIRQAAGIAGTVYSNNSSFVEKEKEVQFQKIKLASGIYVKFAIQ
ncbi:MAG: SIMPL domain-containing protein [Crocinitomicaceae bacterium]|nr:SIMPL domain-containing protein [Crocinitomicaceae bacterium]